VKLISLQSGSNGNCTYVEANGVGLVFDAGLSGSQARRRLAARRREISRADALIISHDHADHVRCMGIYQRKFHLPIHVTAPTLAAAAGWCRLGQLTDVRHFRAGQALAFGDVRVETIPTPHDGADAVAFVVDDGRRRVGILTDLGCVFDGLAEVISTLDAVVLESNYDEDMLADGPYPPFLKARIRGPGGHLSNVEAAELLAAAAGRRMQWACLAHLSEQNNDPRLALETWREAVGAGLPLHVASRYHVGEVLSV
jgi:phosphoribosyl 1,2-cyclic phosphodiesterase